MRVTIDCTPLLLRSAGVKTYLYHWVQALLQTNSNGVRLFPYFDCPGELRHGGSTVGRLRTILNLGLVNFANVRGNPVLDLVARRGIFHASQHLVNPPFHRVCLTATIYDMTCWLMPQNHTPANVAATHLYAERVLQRASACIAISEQTRQDAVRLLGLPANRIEVIYPGVSEDYFSVSPGAIEEVRTRYKLFRNYVLFVGTIEPRKNVDGILDAFQCLPGALRRDWELVLAGPIGWCGQATVERLTSAPGIRYLGYVPEENVPALTAGASIFLFPSFYEGFGLPVAQAMAAGVPVITSRGSSLEEIVGNAGFLVDPPNKEEIAAAVERLATVPSRASDLSARGRLRASHFKWARSAQQSWQFFARLA